MISRKHAFAGVLGGTLLAASVLAPASAAAIPGCGETWHSTHVGVYRTCLQCAAAGQEYQRAGGGASRVGISCTAITGTGGHHDLGVCGRNGPITINGREFIQCHK
ncbi:hypothetical protein [Allokutzneria albata]|uniref:Alpha amylase inhibitor n=1 Tax=Allokutzneria albata TaxID=211114 RepID=A0A1G9YP39_ALLAB|nr:hypothetical protein [Allokutzneria albata]SDN10969.1 hypothetical protein SAMN04489726_4961 [Allokutzneria albata]